MIDGETQNFQGFLSDSPEVIVEPTTPSGYCFPVEHLLTKVICSAVSTDIITKEGAYYGTWRDLEFSWRLVG